MLLWASLFVALISIIIFYRQPDSPSVRGFYKQPGKWFPLKYVIFLIMLQLRRWQNRHGNKAGKKKAGYGMETRLSLADMEVAQPLSPDAKAFDAVFFMAANKDGYYFAAGTERRQHGVINGLCYVAVPGKGLLCSHKLPDTVLFGAKNEEFGAEGLLLKLVRPMKKWKLNYKGKMWLQSDPSQMFDVNFEGAWSSDLPPFNYDTDMYPPSAARAFARETWTREYFKALKKAHQSHYEQMGHLNATIEINGEKHTVKMPSFRDHSYGERRDWNLMHRYAFHMIFLDDGTKATTGVICQPCTSSRLEVGYVYTPSGEVYALEWCDFELYEHGEDGRPPTDYSFSFKAGPTIYTVQVNVEYAAVHYVGWKWEARMVERFVQYTVNGIPGRGVSEFHYYNKGGRPSSVAVNDPYWFKKLTL
ncbi:hypothetical protein L798_06649 [Zootermopsis nevadensis]|uniref:Uncharacterized protein n=1 Tax=Zootermopsis nevadensis TaxID=136037 RepID=A0A067QH61_ZOONE|nr:hypothetical protein L798_06649 [Zootermopsis nevadensis]